MGGGDCAELRQYLGRRASTLYAGIGHESTIRGYLRLGLFPVSSTKFFYEEFIRDVEHPADRVCWHARALQHGRRDPRRHHGAGADG